MRSGQQPFESAPLTGPLDFDEFVEICADPVGGVATPTASEVEHGIPIYDGDHIRKLIADPDSATELRHELANVFGNGAGVIAIRNAWSDRSNLDAMTDVLWQIIEREREADLAVFDHYAEPGANSRAWDTLGKTAKLDPETYVHYYSNPVLHLVSESWLGPWYQLTAQVNVVHPGGKAQSPHRDYHLGFLSDADAARFPTHVHRLSQALTLQGAVVHTAMPIEAGPTMVLPGSQRFLAGYLAWRDERFQQHFASNHVQLPLEPGDAMFFNPGLHHGAGTNRTADHDRMGNLMQVSSAFGVAMEAVDNRGIVVATYPVLCELAAAGELTDHHIATCAAGYSFPTNLDTDTTESGLAPSSAQDLLRKAIADSVSPADFAAQMAALVERQRPA
jgi:ectoine hydroxylase-related dioxygenase (phytanoyl-CoA dioxygenase family)